MKRFLVFLMLLVMAVPAVAAAQSFTDDDPVIRAIWAEGMDRTHAYELAQVLMDSIGPRLTGAPAHKAANDWLVATYRSWGVDARNEQYGTWKSWTRGITHIDLVQPRVRTLNGMMLAWSPGTRRAVEGDVVTLPDVDSPDAFQAWLRTVRGKFVLVSMGEPSCRPLESWQASGTDEEVAAYQEAREAASDAWDARIEATGVEARDLPGVLEEAGAAGVLSSVWSGGWGAHRIFSARTTRVPSLAVACEDYGLLFRLAEHRQGPRLRVEARSEMGNDMPIFNTIAEIRGSELPDEYVVLSAHLDSWDGGSGATDNGTGTINMLEAIRILRQVYPNPKRTILVGHWASEEQGLNGSRAFAADHPEVVEGLQALFNQDNGTGRVVRLSMQGLLNAGEQVSDWLSRVPEDITRHIDVQLPGSPGGGGSDYASFICYGAPSFSLSSLPWDYFAYTWHTNLDTFDKLAFDEVKNNATLTAMLVYLASEDPDRVDRTRRTAFPVNPRTGESMTWPECREARRTSEGYLR